MISGANLSAFPEKDPAGRRFNVGDNIPASLQAVFESSSDLIEFPWGIGIFFFTRQNQPFSQRLSKELQKLLKESGQDSIPVWEIFMPESTENHPTTTQQMKKMKYWFRIQDSENELYDAFGLRVLPTIYLISNNWTILKYLPGYSPASLTHLRKELSKYYPLLFPKIEEPNFNPEEKIRQRRENLVKKLYDRRKYSIALQQLQNLDSLSLEAQILKGLIHIQLNEFSAADSIFTSLLRNDNSKDYAHFGLGIVAFQNGQFDSSYTHFQQVHTIPKMYRVHYWKGRVLENLGETDKALTEYRKGMHQIFRKSGNIYIQ